jgi:hypothetical protein
VFWSERSDFRQENCAFIVKIPTLSHTVGNFKKSVGKAPKGFPTDPTPPTTYIQDKKQHRTIYLNTNYKWNTVIMCGDMKF